MQVIDVQQLQENVASVIAAAQQGEVLVVQDGIVVAVVSKPKSHADAAYWREREALLADVVAAPGWDSTIAVSEDRDRQYLLTSDL